jgi:hypothetical protein
MPAKAKKRIKPVIEEITEEVETPEVSETPDTTPEETTEDTEMNTEAEEKTELVPETESSESKPETETAKEESSSDSKPEKKVNLKMIIVITVISALVAAFVSGGVYVYLSGIESLNTETSEPSPTPDTSSEPTPTASPESEEPVDVSSYSVQVLNGSGAIGAASDGEDILTGANFTVKSTGNAANYNFEATVIQSKKDVAGEAISAAKMALEKEDYEVEIGDTLEESSDYDVVVTIGSN